MENKQLIKKLENSINECIHHNDKSKLRKTKKGEKVVYYGGGFHIVKSKDESKINEEKDYRYKVIDKESKKQYSLLFENEDLKELLIDLVKDDKIVINGIDEYNCEKYINNLKIESIINFLNLGGYKVIKLKFPQEKDEEYISSKIKCNTCSYYIDEKSICNNSDAFKINGYMHNKDGSAVVIQCDLSKIMVPLNFGCIHHKEKQ